MPGVPQTLPVPPLVNEMTMLNAIRLAAESGGGSGGTGTVTSVSVVTANGVSATVATATTTPALTFTLGAITPSSVNALTLAAAATGFTIAGGTSSKTLTVLDTGTAALLGIAQTFSAANIFSVNGAASTPALSLTGTPFTGGTATTTKPLFNIEPTGTTSTGWATAGTMLGVNAASGFAGMLGEFQLNGASKVKLGFDGRVQAEVGGAFPQFCGIGFTNYGMRVASDRLDFWIAGVPIATIASTGMDMGSFRLTFGGGVRLNQPTTNTLALQDASATPITMTLSGTPAVGTNITGGTLNIGTRGTGTGTGGRINLQYHAAGSSGSTLGTLVDVLSIVGAGRVRITGIPTSAAGLSTGDIYSNAGILTII